MSAVSVVSEKEIRALAMLLERLPMSPAELLWSEDLLNRLQAAARCAQEAREERDAAEASATAQELYGAEEELHGGSEAS